MTDKTYNGWTNYATWRVMLEIFDGLETADVFDLTLPVEQLRNVLQDYAEMIVCSGHRYDERGRSDLMEDYARAFMADVNWYEIAEHMLEDHKEETEE